MTAETSSASDVASIDMELQESPDTGRKRGLTLRKAEDLPCSIDENQVDTSKDVEHPNSVILFGADISSFSPTVQFIVCAGGAFSFTIVYGYLQELLAVHVAARKFALFLAVCQFAGYAFWSLLLTKLKRPSTTARSVHRPAPLGKFISLSIVRAFDLAMTNMAMGFINYPAKTLIKSSRIVFTMLLGVLLHNRHYKLRDYGIVSMMVMGLAIFLHADSTSSAVFHPLGVIFLIGSLIGDGTINNMSEKLMDTYGMTQDEYHLRLYSIALVATSVAAHLRHELFEGIDYFLLQPGTVSEIESGNVEDTEWSISRKAIVLTLFSATGIFGASCLGAITKRFGALIMAITSTTRKATTLFLSFFLFKNTCTVEHLFGVVMFVGALVAKSLVVKDKRKHHGTGAMDNQGNHLVDVGGGKYKHVPLDDLLGSTTTVETLETADSSDDSDLETVASED